MSTIASPPSKIQQFIETGIQPRLKEIHKGHDDQLPGLTALANQLVAATKKSDAAKIKKLMTDFKPQVEYVGRLVAGARSLDQALGKVNLNGATSDDNKLFEHVKADVTDLEGKLQRNFSKLKAAEDEANDVLDKIEQRSGKAAGDWAVVQTMIEDHLTDAKIRLKQSQAEFDKFEKARGARNRTDLDKARASLAKLVTGSPSHAEAKAGYEKLLEQSKGNGLDPHAKDQLARDLPGLKKSFDEAASIEAKIAEFNKHAQGWGFRPVDGSRAAQVLKITNRSLFPKIEAALAQGSPGMEKALEGVAKEAKIKMTGDDMVEALRKAKVI